MSLSHGPRAAILWLLANGQFSRFHPSQLRAVNVIFPELIGAENLTVGEEEWFRRDLATKNVLVAYGTKEDAAALAADPRSGRITTADYQRVVKPNRRTVPLVFETADVGDVTEPSNPCYLLLTDDLNELRAENTNATTVWPDQIEIRFPTSVVNNSVD